jgi:predicted transcriptional regulator YdeE
MDIEIATMALALPNSSWQRKPKMSSRCQRQPNAAGLMLQRSMGQLMEPVALACEAFLVVGIKTRTTNRVEAVSETARIPALWRRFRDEKIGEAIPDRLPADEVVAVYTEFENESRGAYSLIIGRKVRKVDRTPQTMAGVTVRGGRYLCFPIEDRTPEGIQHAWDEVRRFFLYSHENERAFATDFEVHRAESSEIYVSVK